MTMAEAKANQERIAQHYNLGWWYGTRCAKCCGVYPKFMRRETFDPKAAYYQCEVCGRRTEYYTMPWLAEEAWNKGETIGGGGHQMTLWEMWEMDEQHEG